MRRLRNLWAWSAISPYDAGQDVGKTMVEAIKELVSPQKSEIVFPNKVTEVLNENPEASLDDLITR